MMDLFWVDLQIILNGCFVGSQHFARLSLDHYSEVLKMKLSLVFGC